MKSSQAAAVRTVTVIGKAVGYYSIGARPNVTRMKKYHAYKELVQWSCKSAGIKLPLHATEKEPLWITTKLYSKTRVHPDPENVHKGAVDSLFYGAKGGDKHVGGRFDPASYEGEDLVVVTIKREA